MFVTDTHALVWYFNGKPSAGQSEARSNNTMVVLKALRITSLLNPVKQNKDGLKICFLFYLFHHCLE